MTTVQIGLVSRGLALTKTAGRPEALLANLRCDGLQAATHIYDPHFSSLAAYFVDLAASWRGWEGTRVWQALEGDLALTATFAQSNLVLHVDLRDHNSGWSAAAEILVEPGEQLAQTASELQSVLG